MPCESPRVLGLGAIFTHTSTPAPSPHPTYAASVLCVAYMYVVSLCQACPVEIMLAKAVVAAAPGSPTHHRGVSTGLRACLPPRLVSVRKFGCQEERPRAGRFPPLGTPNFRHIRRSRCSA